ncbi:DUF1833 family protein [Methylorubrum extorquens]|uniref:DUF1833 family protein n=1 Tax=Methylorubrum extorquens TaxID=408 RepID=UPI003F62E149
MSRRLSASFRAALMAERADEDGVSLVTIRHPLLAEPIRFTSHPTACLGLDPLRYGTTSRGQLFDYIEHQITLPEDADGAAPAFEIQLSNIGRETISLLRSTLEPASVTVELVSYTNPDVVEIEWPDFDLVSADYDEDIVRLGLAIDAMATEPYPCDSVAPSGFRGLF